MKKVTSLIMGMILMIMCFGCSANFNSSQYVPLADAPEQIKDQVDALYQQTIDALQHGDENGIMDIAGSQLKENADNLRLLMEQWQDILTDTPIIMDEYYLTFFETGTSAMTFTVGEATDPDYYFYVQPIAKEMAVTFATVEKETISYMIAQIYVNENNVWKLSDVFATDYTYGGMNAPEMYEKAMKMQKSGELIPATLYSGLMQKILQPANMISYPNAKEMQDFITSCNKQADEKYQFPLTIETEAGNVDVVWLAPAVMQEGIACVIKYITKTPLKDANKSEFEAQGNEIGKVIDAYFQGITENFDVLLAQAYNEVPFDPSKMYDSYTTVIR